MHTIQHVLNTAAWQIKRDGEPWASALSFDDAITFAPDAPLSCEYCGKTNEVRPEILSSLTRVLACKACRKIPTTVNTTDSALEKLSKKPKVVREPSRAEFLQSIRNDAARFGKSLGFRTTGDVKLDRQLRLPYAKLEQPPMPIKMPVTEVPTECQICDTPIGDDIIDGVVVGAGWAYMCPTCHGKVGTGLGTGRGQRYKRVGEEFVKTEG